MISTKYYIIEDLRSNQYVRFDHGLTPLKDEALLLTSIGGQARQYAKSAFRKGRFKDGEEGVDFLVHPVNVTVELKDAIQ